MLDFPRVNARPLQHFEFPTADPLHADVEWHIGPPLDVDAMNDAASRFIGEHDFTSFCRRPKDRPDEPLIRRVLT